MVICDIIVRVLVTVQKHKSVVANFVHVCTSVETCSGVIICEIIVHLLVTVQKHTSVVANFVHVCTYDREFFFFLSRKETNVTGVYKFMFPRMP